MNTKKAVSNFFLTHKQLKKFKMAAINKKLSYFARYRDNNKVSACKKNDNIGAVYII